MSRTECVHENVVVDAVLSGRCPRQCDESLVAHAAACEVCNEVAAITTLIHDDSERSRFLLWQNFPTRRDSTNWLMLSSATRSKLNPA